MIPAKRFKLVFTHQFALPCDALLEEGSIERCGQDTSDRYEDPFGWQTMACSPFHAAMKRRPAVMIQTRVGEWTVVLEDGTRVAGDQGYQIAANVTAFINGDMELDGSECAEIAREHVPDFCDYCGAATGTTGHGRETVFCSTSCAEWSHYDHEHPGVPRGR